MRELPSDIKFGQKYTILITHYDIRITKMVLSGVDAGAVIQGAAVAVVLVGIVGLYLDRMSTISSNIESMSESVGSIDDEVSAVDLADMEKDLTKMISKVEFMANGLGNGSRPPTGEGTVYTELDETELTVGISYVTTHPNSHTTYIDSETQQEDDSYDGPETVVEFEFDEELNMRALGDRLGDDDELASIENELFSREIGFTVSSPFEFTIHFPTGDADIVADFIPRYLKRIDKHIDTHRERKESFESQIEDGL